MVNNRSLKIFFKERHEPVADAGAHSVGVAVRGVFTPRLFLAAEIGAQIGAADFEERTNDDAGGGMDAAKPGEPRAAKDVRQDGFRLIVGGVRNGDAIEAVLLNELLKKGVPRAPRHVFQIAAFSFGFRGDIFRSHEKFQLVLRRKFRNEFLVGLRSSSAQFVIEVHHAQDATQLLAQFKEQMQQGNGIRAAGNGNAQALAGAQQIGALQENQEALCEIIPPGRSVAMRFSLHWEGGHRDKRAARQKVS